MKRILLTLAPATLPLLSACESMPKSESPAEAPKSAEAKPKTSDDDLAKKERAIEVARLELKIAEAECEAKLRKAQDAVDEAEMDLQMKSTALEHFSLIEKELGGSKAKLGVDQATWRLDETKQELAELQAMYDKDDVATLTKELVLRRGQKQVEFSTRALEHARREADMKTGHELPRKEIELSMAKRSSENKLREARADKLRADDEVALKLRKARAAVEDAEKELAKARQGSAPKP
jgi:hypothetical protein